MYTYIHMSFFYFLYIFFLNQVNKKLKKLNKRIILDQCILNNLRNIFKIFQQIFFIFQIRKTYNKFKVYFFLL